MSEEKKREKQVVETIDVLVHPFYGHDKNGDSSRRGSGLCPPPYYENMPRYFKGKEDLSADEIGGGLLSMWLERLEATADKESLLVMFPYTAPLPKHRSSDYERSPYEAMLVKRARDMFGNRMMEHDTPQQAAEGLWRRYADQEVGFSEVLRVEAFGEMSDVCVKNYTRHFTNAVHKLMDQDKGLDELQLQRRLVEELCGDAVSRETLDKYIKQNTLVRQYGIQPGNGKSD